MKIEHIERASQLHDQLSNLKALAICETHYINKGANQSEGWKRVFISEHSDSSGGKIELTEAEKNKIDNLITKIIDDRKISAEREIELL